MNRAQTVNVQFFSRLSTYELTKYEIFAGAQLIQFIRTRGRLERADLHGILLALLSTGRLSGSGTPIVFFTQLEHLITCTFYENGHYNRNLKS